MPTVAGVQIDILYVPDCPHVESTVVRLLEALDYAGLSASIRESVVDTPEDAEALCMRGSPTILVDGRDPFASTDEAGSVSCRLYPAGGSFGGVPSVDQLVAALTT